MSYCQGIPHGGSPLSIYLGGIYLGGYGDFWWPGRFIGFDIFLGEDSSVLESKVCTQTNQLKDQWEYEEAFGAQGGTRLVQYLDSSDS